MKTIVTIALLLFYITAGAQQDTLLTRSVAMNAQYLTVDILGNFYVLEGNSISRYSPDGMLLSTHSNMTDGNFTTADVTDALKILLFSKEFGHIRFLDNMLTTKGDAIQLAELGFAYASLACTSYESGFWIYDPVSIQLVRFDNSLNAVQFSGNIAQLAGFEVHPIFLTECNNMVYLTDTARGLLMFDRYGAYLKTLPFKGVQALQVSGDNLFLYCGDDILAYNSRLQQEQRLKLPVKGSISACLSNKRLHILVPGKLYIYTLK